MLSCGDTHPHPHACPSLPIADELAGAEQPDPVVLASILSVVLATVADPRTARGIRNRLVVLLTVTVGAVAAGARSFVASVTGR